MLGDKDPKGFYRRGLPNAPRPKESDDDPKAFEKVAVDMQMRMEQIIVDKPELGIAQSDIDARKAHYLAKGARVGIKALEDDIENAMRVEITGTHEFKETVIDHLGLALAYLELTRDVNEDFLDVKKDE
ncbi:hypothetical protein A2763_04360 [Candidatus Kaiserbacteria bacterium RIFCSPHIGHO2_01_FULL_54_36]|uniref:Uncharacterized protein n=1 Tax=Candidatus Kaiserbacteria bacterium RIFCSPHIGHO2_01_FULL_54_36 TaxID=1798482 RepID=A0A1F6CN69_9BACT|nr:MAG: hypothetical protein A2763_04360 [Candidatus Kaiserbacteria bacterium RIFCSPHIGHO2_01_FULL_54_36]OGG75857.1 MAG: hypothetical protein A3A41_01395 [Candidatus Kaiserbacteria bacterium RIFCSPLOWO2_01_FULL_54_22]